MNGIEPINKLLLSVFHHNNIDRFMISMKYNNKHYTHLYNKQVTQKKNNWSGKNYFFRFITTKSIIIFYWLQIGTSFTKQVGHKIVKYNVEIFKNDLLLVHLSFRGIFHFSSLWKIIKMHVKHIVITKTICVQISWQVHFTYIEQYLLNL